MTRIIAGSARGRPLRVPAGSGTRPTSDRAREGLFSTLGTLTEIEGARVLDLYAGSGALGLEALSRGAATATLVETDERALAALRANVATLGLPARVVARSVPLALAGPPEPSGEASEGGALDPPYDVALLDPPYELDVTAVLLALVPWLAAGAVVAVERRTRGGGPVWPAGLTPIRSRRYGEATLWYGSRS